eukprot:CAMPEP_0171907194 /NCGR_PEP_ID=MMETSP0993-20121228/6820_1 /TAXON_ID=483369 /ORGANISM="non described non described, Strain CCMP2098" /LENGTH=153 /DNA_ID=CAMNT_0012539377 /DNA_START=247 /DNA_END=705 /DNA_ORIENTATION=+
MTVVGVVELRLGHAVRARSQSRAAPSMALKLSGAFSAASTSSSSTTAAVPNRALFGFRPLDPSTVSRWPPLRCSSSNAFSSQLVGGSSAQCESLAMIPPPPPSSPSYSPSSSPSSLSPSWEPSWEPSWLVSASRTSLKASSRASSAAATAASS